MEMSGQFHALAALLAGNKPQTLPDKMLGDSSADLGVVVKRKTSVHSENRM
jgi:hypothetical protein